MEIIQIIHLQYKMFLLNTMLDSAFLSAKKFTIQNVPIKFDILIKISSPFSIFTIQNVPIKYQL